MKTYPAFVRDLSEDRLEALVEMMFLAASADGEFDDGELAQFTRNAEMLTAGLLKGERLDQSLARAKQALADAGRDARLASVKARLPDVGARKLALSLAIEMSAADGVMRTSEREFILETAEALGIEGETAANMVRDLTR